MLEINREIVLFTRATPGSSLVPYIREHRTPLLNVLIQLIIEIFSEMYIVNRKNGVYQKCLLNGTGECLF